MKVIDVQATSSVEKFSVNIVWKKEEFDILLWSNDYLKNFFLGIPNWEANTECTLHTWYSYNVTFSLAVKQRSMEPRTIAFGNAYDTSSKNTDA